MRSQRLNLDDRTKPIVGGNGSQFRAVRRGVDKRAAVNNKVVLLHGDPITWNGHHSFEDRITVVWRRHEDNVSMCGASPFQEHTV
jgi:hypothetical protein